MSDITITSHKREVLQALNDRLGVGLEACGLAAENYAKNNIERQKAVDTGRLLNSVTHKTLEDTAYVGTNVEYAVYVEMGTGRQAMYGGNQSLTGMKARPYLKPAMSDNVDAYKKILTKYLK